MQPVTDEATLLEDLILELLLLLLDGAIDELDGLEDELEGFEEALDGFDEALDGLLLLDGLLDVVLSQGSRCVQAFCQAQPVPGE